jgi:phosphodiesterase/alkaline phosphatase D-like protein
MKGFLLTLVLVASLALGATALPQPADSKTDAAITNGPVVEGTTDTTAVIAWTTNVNSGTTVKYGTDQDRLSQTAEMPWGGITHRVHLKGLQPGTTYYYQVRSGQAQGSGSTAESQVLSFTTQQVSNNTAAH